MGYVNSLEGSEPSWKFPNKKAFKALRRLETISLFCFDMRSLLSHEFLWDICLEIAVSVKFQPNIGWFWPKLAGYQRCLVRLSNLLVMVMGHHPLNENWALCWKVLEAQWWYIALVVVSFIYILWVQIFPGFKSWGYKWTRLFCNATCGKCAWFVTQLYLGSNFLLAVFLRRRHTNVGNAQ